MPAERQRLLWRFMTGLRAGNSASYTELGADGALVQTGASTLLGASDSKTTWNARGYQTMAGCGRVLRDIWIPAANFDVPLGAASGAGVGASGACGAGSLFASCVLFDITGSVFGGTTGSPAVTALNMGVGGSPASPLSAVATITKPTDADTTGSIIAYVDWTTGQTAATTGSKLALEAALGYLGTGSTIRSAASAGGVGVASYAGTACGAFQTTCIGVLPSFKATDQLGFLALRVGASAGGDSGKLSTACVFILGVRLRYVACALGAQATE